MTALRWLRAWWLGVVESGGDCGLTFDGSPDSPRSRAYDHGRNFGEAAARLRAWWRNVDLSRFGAGKADW